ncbi:MAG: sugar ABC transporter ATP-binding protein [Actinobacteria bacterium]|nr:sugar ABC transporter ATP-binding protein [Actinomycetota bacterium]
MRRPPGRRTAFRALTETMLEAKQISKTFGVTRALVDVDFSVGAGEIVALAGENGSGKSTLAKIVAGALAPDSGTITIDGDEQRFGRPRDALDRGIALVAQEPTACPDMSIAENILLTRLPRPLSPFNRLRYNALARPILETVEVVADPGAPFSSLKAGDRELVEIGKALASEPRYVILDEATSRLGEADVARLFRLLRRLREQGMSFILITHRLPEMVELADRAVILRDGRRVGELQREQLNEEAIASMMVGRELTDYYHKRTVPIGKPMLEVRDLLVEGAPEPISFDVRAGEIVALAGLVGAGRTEVLETIAGGRRPHGGTVSVDGHTLPAGTPRGVIGCGVTLVPEERHRQGLNLVSNVRENVAMGMWSLIRANKRREQQAAYQSVDQMRIRTAGIEAPIRSLSGGNQQKVVIGRCLARDPKVLLLDEPTRGIDVGAKAEVFNLIGELVEQGRAILLVTSDLLEVLGLADRILVLHERRIVGELSREKASEERIAFLSGGGTHQDAA